MKNCTKCKVDYPIPYENNFNKRKSTADGLQNHCKACIAIFHKEHYKLRSQYYKDKARAHCAQYRLRNLQYVVDYFKLHPCVDCGETDPIVLEFDHLRDKKYNVSQLITGSFETLVFEIQKCEVRCANCHRRKTAIQFGFYKGITL